MKERIVFMGSPEFALPSLEGLAGRFQVTGVVSQPDRPAGRGRALSAPPVKDLAQRLEIEIIQPEKLRQPGVFEQLQAWRPDVIVVAAFGQILRQNVLDLPRFGCINVHASLLPRWRGAAPIQAAILHGDPQTGVTIMKMDAGVDTGDILAQETEEILEGDDAETLSRRLAQRGADLLLETLPGYLAGDISPVPQDGQLATRAVMLQKEDGRLEFSRPARDLALQVRAYSPWPGAFTEMEDGLLKVRRARAVPGSAAAGSRTTWNGLPAFGCAEGLLVLDEVQPAGKKAMPGEVFLRGARGWKTA